MDEIIAVSVGVWEGPYRLYLPIYHPHQLALPECLRRLDISGRNPDKAAMYLYIVSIIHLFPVRIPGSAGYLKGPY
jgi:hypothetical protein